LEKERKLKIAVHSEIPCSEADFISEIIRESSEVVQTCMADDLFHGSYDLVFGIGPVRSRPLGYRSVLIALGPTTMHQDLEWDIVVATCERSYINLSAKMGQDKSYVIAKPPLLNLQAGSRRLVDKDVSFISASSYPPLKRRELRFFRRWTSWSTGDCDWEPYSELEYNSAIKAGGIGWYADLQDGYDLQARRHFALGSGVVCKRDSLVLGDLAEKCVDQEGISNAGEVRTFKVEEPTEELMRSYRKKIKELMLMM